MKFDNLRLMKLNRLYILSLIVVMLTAMSFDISSPKLMDSTSQTQVEISLEEEKISDENLVFAILELYLKNTKVFTGFYCSNPLVKQLYINDIFEPPKFS